MRAEFFLQKEPSSNLLQYSSITNPNETSSGFGSLDC